MWQNFRELLMAHKAVKAVAEQFMGEVPDEKYSTRVPFTELVTGEKVYLCRGFDSYDLIIQHGVLSSILREMPWILSKIVFNGNNEYDGICIEFTQKGPWHDATAKPIGNCMVFEEVWSKHIDNLEACERVEEYRFIFEEIIKDYNAQKETNKKKKPKT